MDVNEILEIVKQRITEKRYIHTLGVIEEAVILGKIYNLDLDKLRVAAALHDISKHEDTEYQREALLNNFSKDEIELLPVGAYHAYMGSLRAKELGINDNDILDSIKYHTVGRRNMSMYEKVIFISDFSEPNRDFPQAKICHDIAVKDIDEAMLYALKELLKMLEKDKKIISPLIYDVTDYFKEVVDGKN